IQQAAAAPHRRGDETAGGGAHVGWAPGSMERPGLRHDSARYRARFRAGAAPKRTGGPASPPGPLSDSQKPLERTGRQWFAVLSRNSVPESLMFPRAVMVYTRPGLKPTLTRVSTSASDPSARVARS